MLRDTRRERARIVDRVLAPRIACLHGRIQFGRFSSRCLTLSGALLQMTFRFLQRRASMQFYVPRPIELFVRGGVLSRGLGRLRLVFDTLFEHVRFKKERLSRFPLLGDDLFHVRRRLRRMCVVFFDVGRCLRRMRVVFFQFRKFA